LDPSGLRVTPVGLTSTRPDWWERGLRLDLERPFVDLLLPSGS